MNTPKRLILILAGLWSPVTMVLLSVLLFSSQANAQCQLVISGKLPLRVCEGWEVVVRPVGYNAYQFDPEWNPTGKAPGWGGWPLLNSLCAEPEFRAENPKCTGPKIDKNWELIRKD